jgi:hypothetical protein
MENPRNRKTVTVALNLLVGAAVITRVNWLQLQGLFLKPALTRFRPLTTDELATIIDP